MIISCRSKSMILREAILPIEIAVHDYTVEILKGLKSVFIADTRQRSYSTKK